MFKIVCDVKGCGASFSPGDKVPGLPIDHSAIVNIELPHGWCRIERYEETSPELPSDAHFPLRMLELQADLAPEAVSDKIHDMKDALVKEARRKIPMMILRKTFYVCDCHELPLPALSGK